MSYDIKFRRHVLKVRSKQRLTFIETGKLFGINKQTVYNWSKRIEEKKIRKRLPNKIDMEALKKDIILYPDDYQYERASRFNVSAMGISHALKRLKISYKKKA